MTIGRSRTFRSGNSEALRLPKDVAFGEDVELVMIRSGNVLTVYPAVMAIGAMMARLRELPVPYEVETRDIDDLPEPLGL